MNDVGTLIGGPDAINAVGWYLAAGTVLFALGLVRSFLARARLTRIISLNVMGFGALIILVTVGARDGGADPVLTALAITGLVITVAFTGVAVALARALEAPDPDPSPQSEVIPGPVSAAGTESALDPASDPGPGSDDGEVDAHVRR